MNKKSYIYFMMYLEEYLLNNYNKVMILFRINYKNN